MDLCPMLANAWRSKFVARSTDRVSDRQLLADGNSVSSVTTRLPANLKVADASSEQSRHVTETGNIMVEARRICLSTL